MKKNDQQRLMLNIIILVISAFILIFMLLGKFLSSADPVSLLKPENQQPIDSISYLYIKKENA